MTANVLEPGLRLLLSAVCCLLLLLSAFAAAGLPQDFEVGVLRVGLGARLT
jgi:hypothetical protein